MTQFNQPSDAEKAALIAELRQIGIKHTPENILRIAKLPDGKIVFLELGDNESGLQHILKEHSRNFVDIGISPDQIPDVVMAAVTIGRFVCYQGRSRTRLIYELTFNGQTHYIAVTIGSNGYIVGANPRTSP
ncbi:hypothetical protein [Kamptonema sp. UHCC 0994]|uniref:hypothetical protein n=1 Tax=Kamptonema sp. UHCC 0994 TaxID=3031329 RepID=UPI0023B9C47D|nr:hypothetical protein [Kamptonema sp. UHCC 0994]MDF0554996.1 hypothetical protein [Kamptonema sp. UHCC 0994]